MGIDVPSRKMETHTCRLMPRSVPLFAALLMLPFVAIPTARGDAAAELASFSAFPKVDLAQLRGRRKTGPRRFVGKRTLSFRADGLRGAVSTRGAARENAQLESGAPSGVEGLSAHRQRDKFLRAPERPRQFGRPLSHQRDFAAFVRSATQRRGNETASGRKLRQHLDENPERSRSEWNFEPACL